jgi:hypothetical protein
LFAKNSAGAAAQSARVNASPVAQLIDVIRFSIIA